MDWRGAFESGIEAAERYKPWDAWSLSHDAIACAVRLIDEHKLRRVVEFGAGYSTVALDAAIGALNNPCQIFTHDHQHEYASKVRAAVDVARTRVFCAFLARLRGGVRSIETGSPWVDFAAGCELIPFEDYQQTRLVDCFYWLGELTVRDLAPAYLLILDGPNGNGRSIAFPLLRDVMRFPSYAIIDDCEDYPFMADMARTFAYEVIEDRISGGKRWAAVKITGRAGNA